MKKLKIKRNIRLGLIVILPIIVIGLVLYKTNIYDKDIDRVLKTDAYNYLNSNALNYIKKVYEETGEIILTEKNKKENTPYLNPVYVEYLNLTDEEKNNVDLLPDTYIIDYFDNNDNNNNAELPTKYDLRDVDGKNYISAIKNQGKLSLCWSFASIENAETYLMYKDKEPYVKNTSKEFSIRQMDYATSTNGISNYKNEYGYRKLTSGGNFFMSSMIIANGLTLVDNSYMPYNERTDKKKLVDILSYENASYEADSFVHLPKLSTSSTKEDIESYTAKIKNLIMQYGGAYVGTYSPQGSCGSKNKDGSYFIEVDDCYKHKDSGSHAMQLIGWDDDYEYSYCKKSLEHSDVSGDGTCDIGNLMQGKGAWLIRNSWGEETDYKYVYLTYNSVYADFGFVTSLEETNNKKWDNVYSDNPWENGNGYAKTIDENKFNKKGISNEKIEKVKFYSYGVDSSYSLSISSKSNSYNNIKTINVEYPGYVTFDLSDKNIIISDDTFDVKIVSNNDTDLITDSISVFTSNTSSDIEVNLNKYNNITIIDRSYNFYSETKNIPYKGKIEYKLYDENNEDKTSYITYENNLVARNNVNTVINFGSELSAGKYRLEALYNSSLAGTVYFNYTKMSGVGTEDSPYIITKPEELYQIKYDLDAYYELGNDIDLTEITREGGSLFNENPSGPGGYGWEAINGFSGTLDGKGYTIKGLYQNNYLSWEDDQSGQKWSSWRNDSNGLFGTTHGNLTIKNLTLEDFDINCQGGYCGILVSKYDDNNSDYSDKNKYTATFENIIVKNSKTSGVYNGSNSNTSYRNTVGGGLLGLIASSGEVYINNIYLDFDVNSSEFNKNSYLIHSIASNNTTIKNIQIIGNIKGINNNGSGSNVLFNEAYSDGTTRIKNILSTIYDTKLGSNLFGTVWGTCQNIVIDSINLIQIPNKDLFYRFDKKDLATISNINIYDRDTQISELTKIENYSTWENFDDNWVIKTVDGIPRIPVLKFVDFEYTKINNINYNQVLNEKKSVYDYITPNTRAAKRILYKSNDESIVKFDDDGNLIPQKSGTTSIHIESLYDGYINDVPITINYKPHYTIHFDSNTGVGKMNSVEVSTSDNYKLPENKFEKEYYEFVGWNTKSDGTGISYDNLDEIKKLKDKEEITLYAQWIGVELTITFDPNGGTVDKTTKTIRYGDKIGDLPLPRRDNYAFNYWLYKDMVIDIDDNFYRNTVLKASWNKNAYNIVYYGNGGVNTKEYINELEIVLSKEMFIRVARNNSNTEIDENIFDREGYTFIGWNTKSDGTGTSYNVGQVITGNSLLTLYAQWKRNIQSITNSTTDFETTYDGSSHTISIDVDINDYDIVYSTDGKNYNINTIPTYKEVGEYIIYYKITKDGYEDLLGSNKIKIYGIKSFDNTITVKNNILVVNDISFANLQNKINIYSNSKTFKHLDIENNAVKTDNIKTGDSIKININDLKNYNYAIAYLGDVNGDGNIGIIDYIRIMKDIMGTSKLSGVYYEAADMNRNGNIDIIDYIRIMKIIMEDE